MRSLTDIQQEIKLLAVDDIGQALKRLKEYLPEQSGKYNELLALEAQLKETNTARIKNLLSFEEMQRQYAQIREALNVLVDGLEEADFSPAQKEGTKSRHGSILYQIPPTMQLEEETRCIVRLAFEESVILEHIELTEDTKLESIRISDVMGVELLDPSEPGKQAFSIRKVTEETQFLDRDDYTEWLFYVKPLQEGSFPLLLKVSVVEIRQGIERKRDIVMEEMITIVTASVREVPGFKKAETNLKIGGLETAVGKELPKAAWEDVESLEDDSRITYRKGSSGPPGTEEARSIPPPESAGPKQARRIRLGNLRNMAAIIMALIAVGVVITWQIGGEGDPASNVQPTIRQPELPEDSLELKEVPLDLDTFRQRRFKKQ